MLHSDLVCFSVIYFIKQVKAFFQPKPYSCIGPDCFASETVISTAREAV